MSEIVTQLSTPAIGETANNPCHSLGKLLVKYKTRKKTHQKRNKLSPRNFEEDKIQTGSDVCGMQAQVVVIGVSTDHLDF